MTKSYKSKFKFHEFAWDSVSNRNHIKAVDYRDQLITKSECYQSMYAFDDSIISYLGPEASKKNTSVAGIEVPVWSDEVVLDIDFKDQNGNGDVERAVKEVRNLLHHFETNYEINLSHIKIEFSGNKGFHLRIPAAHFGGFEPSVNLPDIHKHIVMNMTKGYDGIDHSIYNRTRLMRIENTKHGKSSLFSIPLEYNEIFSLTSAEIKEKANKPNLSYSFIDSEELIESESLVELKESAIQYASSNYVTRTDNKNLIPKELDISLWKNLEANCDYINSISKKSKKNELIDNKERLFLASHALPFGVKGKLKVHELLTSQNNYSSEKTDQHLRYIEEKGYKPLHCDNVCKLKCPPIKVINKNSPIAFAYIRKVKYSQTKALNLFADSFKETLLFTPTSQSFYLYTDGVYREVDRFNLGRFINTFLLLHFKEDTVTEYGIKALIERIKMSDHFIFNGSMNRDHLLINLKNGMLDLRTNELLEHATEYKSTVQLNVVYDPVAKCNLFDEKLREIFDDNHEKIDYMLQWMLYCMLPTYQHQKFLIMLGTGRNGKGVLTNILVDILGKENCAFESFSDLAADKNYSLINLMDKYVNIASELSNKESETDTIKRLTGGDYISSREIYKGKLQFKNFAKLLLVSNSIPRVTNFDKAFLSRVEILEFTKSFEANPDTNLTTKLNSELSGILNRILSKSSKLLRDNGEIKLQIPESIKQDQSKYKSSFHSVCEFIDEECTLTTDDDSDIDKGVKLKILYERYREWCQDESGYRPVGKKAFKEMIATTSQAVSVKIPYVKTAGGFLGEKNQVWVLGLSLSDSSAGEISFSKQITEEYRKNREAGISITEEKQLQEEDLEKVIF